MVRVLTLLLALTIAVTSQHMAMARGMMHDAAGQVILCTGQGIVTVTLDANGEPMEPVHICPDCALTLMAAMDTPVQAEAQVIHMQTLAQTPVRDPQTAVIPTNAHARAPPMVV